MKIWKYIALLIGSACSAMAQADALDDNCMELNHQCMYTALQQRDVAHARALMHPDLIKELEQKPDALNQVMALVPKTDPLAIEVPMDMEKMQSQNLQQLQKIYLYIYSDRAVRMRVLYDSVKPDAKVRSFGILPIQPK